MYYSGGFELLLALAYVGMIAIPVTFAVGVYAMYYIGSHYTIVSK